MNPLQLIDTQFPAPSVEMLSQMNTKVKKAEVHSLGKT